jgi:hypothetical protein
MNVLSLASKLPLLLSLLLLLPRVGLAFERAPATREVLSLDGSELPGTAPRESLRLLEEPSSQEPQRERPSRGLRILAETGAGLLTGGGAGLLLLLGLSSACSNFSCLGAAVAGGLVGMGLGFPLGVWWGGEAAGGDGKLLGALGGMGAGVVAGFLVALVTGNFNSGYVIAIPFSLAGAIVGYELTERGDAPSAQAPAVAFARPRLQPMLSVSPRGALLGLGGSF